jgi:four helix bundle protein
MARSLKSRAHMPEIPIDDLCERTFRFSSDVYDYAVDLERLGGLPRRLAYQLFDAAGSVGANREEARAAYSRKDFAAKNSISLRESREAKFWLRLADAKNLGHADRRTRLLKEADELVAIFTKIVKRLQT